jgi:beta-lactamase regulating signal transducer with metallopeptidase domain
MAESDVLRECVRFALPLLPVLLSVFVKISLLLGFAFAAAAVMKGASARQRHLLWLTAIGACLAVLALSLNGPLFRFAARPLPLGTVSSSLLPASSVFAAPSGLPPLAAAVRPPATGGSLLIEAWPALVVLLWMAGFSSGLLRLAAARLHFSRLVRQARPAPAARYRSLLLELSHPAGIRSNVRVLESSRCTSPLTRGILRPVILLPPAVGTWSVDGRRSVLLHELRHIRRADSCTLAIAYGICSLLWFIPPIWAAHTRLYQEQEKACDAAVIDDGVKPHVYASCLLDATRLSREPALIAGLSFAGRRRRILKDRIQTIIRGGTAMKRGAVLLGFVAALLAALVALSAAGKEAGNLFVSASRGTPQEVQAALDSGADVNGTEKVIGLTPLMLAAKTNRNPDVIRTLIQAGAAVSAREFSRGTTALQQAALYNSNPEVIQALLEAGADVNDTDYAGIGVLQYAAMGNRNPAVITAIVAGGAPINRVDPDGRTALMFAASYRNLVVIPALLQTGGDGRIVSSIGKTAFELLDPRLEGTDTWALLDKARR